MSGGFHFEDKQGKWREGDGNILREQQELGNRRARKRKGYNLLLLEVKQYNESYLKKALQEVFLIFLAYVSLKDWWMGNQRELARELAEAIQPDQMMNTLVWQPSQEQSQKSGSNESSRNSLPPFGCMIPGIKRRIHGWRWLNWFYNIFILS